MAYNGWSNWETWNLALWLGNDEGVYRQAMHNMQRVKRGPVNAKQAEELVRDIYPVGTPDFRSKHHGEMKGAKWYATVDWDEIANDLNEMAGFDEEVNNNE